MQKISTHYPTTTTTSSPSNSNNHHNNNPNDNNKHHNHHQNIQKNNQHKVAQNLPKKLIQKERIITLQSSKKMEFQKNQTKPQSRYWTKVEHELFLEALEKFGPKDVKSISSFVGSRTPTQVRTHAQKYFLRLKRGTNERTFLDENLYKPPTPATPTTPPTPTTISLNSDIITPTHIIPSDNDNLSPKKQPQTFTHITPNYSSLPQTSDPPNNNLPMVLPISKNSSIHSNLSLNDHINTPPINIPLITPVDPIKIQTQTQQQPQQAMTSSLTQIISPVIKNNSNQPFIRKSEVVKKLVPNYPISPDGITESHSLVQRRSLTKDDISKLGYAMKVYKHIKDYSTKINCIQRHFFPNTSTEELHVFLTEFFSENPHAIHADFFLLPPSPYPCGNACENLSPNLYDHPSKEINFEKDTTGCEDRSYLDVNVSRGGIPLVHFTNQYFFCKS